jgi:hypothetical protein
MATTPQKATKAPEAPPTSAPVAETALKKEWEQGFRGTEADPTPNHNYTLAGVVDPDVRVPEEFKVQTGVAVLPDPNYGQK